MLVSSVSACLSQIKAGKARPLALFGGQRSKALPDVPTMKEPGYDVEYYLWVGMFAPKGTPANVITYLREVLNKAAHSEQFKTALANLGQELGLHGSAGIRGFLGGRYQAHRSGDPRDRQGRGLSPQLQPARNRAAPTARCAEGGERRALDHPHRSRRRAASSSRSGSLVLALSGDLPVGTLSFPGAGMMPKLVAGLMILFGLLLIVRAGESAPLASLAWGDLPHAARVVAITAVAIALYQPLGFVVTMALLLFTLTFGVERRPLFAAAASAPAWSRSPICCSRRAQDAARARHSRILAMGTLESLLLGFSVALQPDVLWYAFLGCLVGTIVGVLPGIGPLSGISILLPATFGLDTTKSVVMLAGIYYGSQYGGSTTSILMRIPGEASSVMTCIDGYAMAQKGRAGAALCIAAVGSWIAGTFGVIMLTLIAPPLATFALRFGPPEYTALLVLGLIFLAYMSSTSLPRTC